MKQSKLTDSDMAEMKRRFKLYKDNSPKRIAADFGISLAYVHQIVSNYTYMDRKANATAAPRGAAPQGNSKLVRA